MLVECPKGPIKLARTLKFEKGFNRVPTDIWKQHSGRKIVRLLVQERRLVVYPDMKPSGDENDAIIPDKLAEDDMDTTDEEPVQEPVRDSVLGGIRGMNVREATVHIKSVLSEELLQSYLHGEDRSTVRKAVEEQLALLASAREG